MLSADRSLITRTLLSECPAAIAWNSTERLRKAYRPAVVVPEPDGNPTGPHTIEKVA